MPLCREVHLVKYAHQWRQATALKCRSWGCEHCNPDRQKALRRMARHGEPNMFLTLTHRRSDDFTPAEAARRLVDAWQLVVKRIKRHYAYKRLPFLAVFEAHKSGYPHLHVLLRCKWIDHHVISAWMDELADSPIVDVRRVRTASQAASYITKYVGKAPGLFGSCKRYWTSQDWQIAKPDEPILMDIAWDWCERSSRRLFFIVDDWLRHGAAVTWLSEHRVRARWAIDPGGSPYDW